MRTRLTLILVGYVIAGFVTTSSHAFHQKQRAEGLWSGAPAGVE